MMTRSLLFFLPLAKKYDPDEPRAPRGETAGGQWVKLGAGEPHPQGHRPTTAEERASALEAGAARPVPPASWGLLVRPNPRNPKLIATYYDDKNRVQYIYNKAHTENAGTAKFESLHHFAQALPGLRNKIARDLRQTGLTRERVAAGILRIVDTTAIRVGSERYADENETFGASSMRKSHVTLMGNRIRFNFVGKRGKEHDIEMRDPAVAALLRELMAQPGERLMQFGKGGKMQPFTEAMVNQYLPAGLHVHQFRHYRATKVVVETLERFGKPRTQAEAQKNVREAIKIAAAYLHNSPAQCRKSYVDPAVINRYLGQAHE